ncbi:MAG: tRNA pseudouridine(13) synthase TruD [Campylobacterota bacterium]|nr:tRNA pseudouridine(13) synthase TruD [Campylobacterota bacterium]
MDRFYAYSHAPIPFHFRQTPRDFVVDEIPLYEFSGEGEHLVLHVRKKNLTTWQMLELIAKHLKIRSRDIGYAGLKDKNAQTKQYISIHKQHEEKMKSFENDGIKILSKTYHNNKIKIGHLRGNRFFIRLKKVNPTDAQKIGQVLHSIKKFGIPNYFGFQRFGVEKNNYKIGEEILFNGRKERNAKLKKMYINAYQSHLFNLWLSSRLEKSKLISSFEPKEIVDLLNIPEDILTNIKKQQHPFKLLDGDVMMHYPYGRLYSFEATEEEVERFTCKNVSPTGLLAGKRAQRATALAHLSEKEFDFEANVDGARRYAWIFPEDIEGEYKENEAWYELHFSLPKGSYATVLIEEIAGREIRGDKNESS